MNKETIKLLVRKEWDVLAELGKVQAAIKALQSLCEHTFVYDGHGHNYSHYTCSTCGAEEER